MLSSCSLCSSAQPAISQEDKPPVRGPPSYFRQSPLSYQQSRKGRSRLAVGQKSRRPTEFFRSLLGGGRCLTGWIFISAPEFVGLRSPQSPNARRVKSGQV